MIKRGELYYADLSPVVGSEQGGIRPVLVVQNDIGNKYSPTIIAAAVTSKINKARKAPIEVSISLGDERVVFSTGKVVAIDAWNKDKQCVRGVNPEAVILNEYIKNMRVRIYEEEIKLVKHGFAVTATLLRDSLMNKVELVKEETILGVFRKHNELQYKQIGHGVSKGTYTNSKQGLDLLERFIRHNYNRKDVHLRELNRDFIEEYRIWLLTEHKLSHNGAVKILALLKNLT